MHILTGLNLPFTILNNVTIDEISVITTIIL